VGEPEARESVNSSYTPANAERFATRNQESSIEYKTHFVRLPQTRRMSA